MSKILKIGGLLITHNLTLKSDHTRQRQLISNIYMI